MITLTIPQNILDKMVAHCRAGYPDEVCGILAGKDDTVGRIYEMTNADPSPVSYLMDPGEQFRALREMRADGTDMTAIYHSHPQSQAYPSSKDVSLAFYPDSLYIIVGLTDYERPEIRAYSIVDGKIGEAELRIVS